VDLLLANLQAARKPEGVQVLCAVTSGDKFHDYLRDGLKGIFGESVRILRQPGSGIEHDEIRRRHYECRLQYEREDPQIEKLKAVFKTYQLLLSNVDRSADFFWFIEDDTLFPLDVFDRYLDFMRVLRADIVTGVSYYWHTQERHARNFWSIKDLRDKDGVKALRLDPIPGEREGVVRLGATGLGNVLAKAESVLSWTPESYMDIGSGADISFFYNAMRKGFRAFGLWDTYLPHITKHVNGDIEIRGRIDTSLLPLIGAGRADNS